MYNIGAMETDKKKTTHIRCVFAAEVIKEFALAVSRFLEKAKALGLTVEEGRETLLMAVKIVLIEAGYELKQLKKPNFKKSD